MNELIGKECSLVFDLPSTEWPIHGYPAFVRVLAVDMPLIKMVNSFVGDPIWVNAKHIKTIRCTEQK